MPSIGSRFIAVGLCAGALFLSTGALAANGEKAGPLLVDLSVGPSFLLASNFGTFGGFTQFALSPKVGYAVADDAYITFAPSFQFGSFTTVFLPVGFQYDIPIAIDNLYLTPRVGIGLAIFSLGGFGSEAAFAFIPEIGAKYQLTKQFHVGLDPVSIPMAFSGDGWIMNYRIMASAGLDIAL